MQLRFTKSFGLEYKKVVKGNDRLKAKIDKQLHILQENPAHPSLRLHKLSSQEYWSISIDRSIRILIIIKKEWIYVYHIGKHEDIY